MFVMLLGFFLMAIIPLLGDNLFRGIKKEMFETRHFLIK
jgi:hypothetical protein